MSRKDSKGMFAAVLGQLSDPAPVSASQRPRINSPHLLKVAAGVRELQERHDLAEKVLAEGEHVLELDPDKVDQSAIADRFTEAYDLGALEEIISSMRENGQAVPGLVRPSGEGRYQIVYGRRRLAAARFLNIPFRAIVRDLSNDDAVILQGAENVGREELTFIEKCAFARAQEAAGFRRETICASLATGKSHVSEMIRIGKSIPADLLAYVGSAPAIGRPRWSELAELLQDTRKRAIALDMVQKTGRVADSNTRFNKIYALLASKGRKRTKPQVRQWTDGNGRIGVSVRSSEKGTLISLERDDGVQFGVWISDHIEQLYADFQRRQAEKDN